MAISRQAMPSAVWMLAPGVLHTRVPCSAQARGVRGSTTGVHAVTNHGLSAVVPQEVVSPVVPGLFPIVPGRRGVRGGAAGRPPKAALADDGQQRLL